MVYQFGKLPGRQLDGGQALEDARGAEVFGGAAHDDLDLGGNLHGEDLAEKVQSLPQRAHAASTLRAADA